MSLAFTSASFMFSRGDTNNLHLRQLHASISFGPRLDLNGHTYNARLPTDYGFLQCPRSRSRTSEFQRPCGRRLANVHLPDLAWKNQNYADDVIDGADCTLIPGLIDAKIDAGAAPWVFPKFAAAGVTTVIDASSETADAQAMRRAASRTPGWPSYSASGSAAGAPGATGWKGLDLFPYRSVEAVCGSAEAEQFVLKRAAKTFLCDFVRVITDMPGLDDQTLHALVGAAHRQGKLVIAHATQLAGKIARTLRLMVMYIVLSRRLSGRSSLTDADTTTSFLPPIHSCFVRPLKMESHKAPDNPESYALHHVQ
jgi:hypothetical protein